MLYFKDVVTELVESILPKKMRMCPHCHQAVLKKNPVVEHYCEVAAVKLLAFYTGGTFPAPDYWFKCPHCKSIFAMVEGKFIPLHTTKN